MVTLWCSLRRRANDLTGRAGRPLCAARGRCFAIIRAHLNPTSHSIIDCALQSPIRPLYCFFRWLFTAFLARAALSTMGFWWIDVDTVSKKRSYISALPPPLLFLTRVRPPQPWHSSERVLEAERRGPDSLQLGLVGRTSVVGIPVIFFTSLGVRHAYSQLLPSTVVVATASIRSSFFPLLPIPPTRPC